MDDDLKRFFETADQLLQRNNSRTDDRLKQHLSKMIDGKLPCAYLYHAWSIAEMCCASPDWSLEKLHNIFYPTGYHAPVSDILKDLFHSLKNTEVPHTKGNLDPDTDNKILLLDRLKRVELDQAVRLGVELYTLSGNVLK